MGNNNLVFDCIGEGGDNTVFRKCDEMALNIFFYWVGLKNSGFLSFIYLGIKKLYQYLDYMIYG